MQKYGTYMEQDHSSGVPQPPQQIKQPQPTQPVEPTTPVSPQPFATRDWAIVAMALAQAVLWVTVLWPSDLYLSYPGIPGLTDWTILGLALPGIGLTLVQLAGLGCTLCAIGRRGRYDRTTVPLLVACMMMCTFPTLFGNQVLRVLNCLVLWVTETHALFLVANLYPAAGVTLASLVAALQNRIVSLVCYVPKPFVELGRAVAARRTALQASSGDARDRSQVREVLLGVFVAVPLRAVVYPLLASADNVFAAILADAGNALARALFPDLDSLLCRMVFALMLAPFLFSLMWGLARTNETATAPARTAPRRGLRTTSVAVVLAALNLMYALFVAVQLVFLFAGFSTATYAEDARSGFFQLVAVASINVIVSLVVVRFAEPRRVPRAGNDSAGPCGRPSPVVTALLWLLVAMTYAILASAALRMWLYVDAYGLTILRCLTFLGMAFIAVVLAMLVAKTFVPSFGFYRAALAGGLALWLVFNLVNIDAVIANHNVDAIINGSLEQIDIDYFWHLSSDADVALKRLETSSAARGYRLAIRERLEASAKAKSELPWQMQCLPYWRVGQAK